jgi:fumarate reductase subunit D
MEWVDIFITALVSFLVYIPVRVLPSSSFCLPFSLVFVEKNQERLALTATVILFILAAFLLVGLLVVGYNALIWKMQPGNTGKRDEISSDHFLRIYQRRNPDRKLIFYGLAILVQYVSLLHLHHC